MRMLCEAYESYHQGLPTALLTLQSLADHAEFSHFTATDFSLQEFLEKPLSHLADLYCHLATVMDVTMTTHQDYLVLQSVIKSKYSH